MQDKIPMSLPPLVLLYLHKHRINDLKNYLKSLERVSQLQITLIVSNQTVMHIDSLLETEHVFAVYNIEKGNEEPVTFTEGAAWYLLWKEFSRSYSRFNSRYQRALKFFEDNKQAVVLTYDDRMPSLISILKASYKQGVPVFLPAVLTVNPDINATTSNTLKPKRKIESLVVRLIKRIYPNHVNAQGRLFYAALDYLVLLKFNALPQKPWVKGTLKYTQKLGVESMLTLQKLLDAGVDENKLELTGMPVYDLMNFSRDESNRQEMLLCALPQYGEHGAMKRGQALPIIEEILAAFNCFSGKVVVSLHPRMDAAVYTPMVEKHGFRCVVGDVDTWLKKASVFFAASSSTTIYSALMMGVPTVLFNHVPPRSNLFRDFASLTYIEKNASAEIEVALRGSNEELVELIKEDQNKLSRSIVTDGHCGLRNVQVIQQLAKSNR